MKADLPTCQLKDKCFAKAPESRKCMILIETGPTCSFCKEFRDITNGREYPFKRKGDTNGQEP